MEIKYFENRGDWRKWLADNFETASDVWFVFPSKSSGEKSITYNDAVEEALCFGWIDSTIKALDKEHKIQHFTPRNPKSSYSQANKERLKWLLEHQMIHPDWEDNIRKVLSAPFVFPNDIIGKLKEDKTVWENYLQFSDAYRRIRIAYIEAARKRPEEFEKRLNNFIHKTKENKMIKGFRFTNQLANAEVDARIHQEFLNKNDGIFYGMDLSKTINSITIAEGLCEIAGRPVAVINNETVEIPAENLYCLLILEIDLSKESTKDTFEQAYFKILTSNSNYPDVTQKDINKYNGTDVIYQLEFARFKSGVNGISDFKDTRQFLNFSGIYSKIKADCEIIIEQIKQELKNVEDGSEYLLKSGGKIDGDLEVEKTIKCDTITNSKRK